MKDKDWNDHVIPVLVECFAVNARRPLGVSFKLKAGSYREATDKTNEVLEQHHGSFVRKTNGHFKTKFSKLAQD